MSLQLAFPIHHCAEPGGDIRSGSLGYSDALRIPGQSFRTTKLVFPSTRSRWTQPRRTTSLPMDSARDAMKLRWLAVVAGMGRNS